MERGTPWTATMPSVVIVSAVAQDRLGAGRHYDVSPDGQRFLVLRDAPTPDAAPPELIVIQHFDALLQRLVPGQ